jgi:4-aminobutyrate aminotransferase / (S)-3-amino-2-methylpropionate transaminase / 5-aminovalerate transaminase
MSLESTSIVEELGSFLVPNTNTVPVLVKGEGAEVVDDVGKRYIDLEAGPGVSSVGHCHPRVVQAIREQAGIYLHSSGRYHSKLALTLARRISDAIASGHRKIFFSNSGAEANEGAVKMGLKYALASGKQGFGIFALEHSFHGRLSLTLSLTGLALRKKGFGPFASFPGVVHMPAPYCYRCPLAAERDSPKGCGLKCAEALREAMKTKVPGDVAVMIAEPIIGAGGIIVPPDEYWSRVQEICTEYKITLVMDEVFAGFGRSGKMFGHQHFKLMPDIVTFAKAIGGGLPLGGFAATAKVSEPFETGDHFTTFGSNNQVGLAAGHAVLDVLASEKLPERAATAGARFMNGLKSLQSKYEIIGDVRGLGLMIGVELVEDRKAKTPAAKVTKEVCDRMRDMGVLAAPTGVFGCVIRFSPPLCLTDAQIDKSLEVFEKALATAVDGNRGARSPHAPTRL